MGWFRTETGHLIHAEGSHAAVCVASGWERVDDDTAVAEAITYEKKRLAAEESAKWAAARKATEPVVVVEHHTHADLTPDELADVDKAIRDETPPVTPRVRRRS